MILAMSILSLLLLYRCCSTEPTKTGSVSHERCKCVPSSNCWPSPREWQDLNTSVSGNLIQPSPPAHVCYPQESGYSPADCAQVLTSWFDSRFHAADPISIDYPVWANDSCDPIYPNGTSVTGDPGAGAKGCTIGNYPVYVINATDADMVSTAVKWAWEKNIRLVVKNTGHNLLGRSTGFGSLSIWTHHMRGIEFIEDFQADGCSTHGEEKQRAARIAAGERDIDLYAAMAEHDAIVVGGSNPTVGIMGWFQGGGHGPLSSSYGMGADNLLQATVVTPNGEIVTANECQYSDLFFALRGGGGGTFGIVIEAVMKAYPNPVTSSMELTATITHPLLPNATSRWWDLMAYIHSEMPRLKAEGAQGYYGILGPPASPTLTLLWNTYHYNVPNSSVEALYTPIVDRLRAESDFVTFETSVVSSPSFFELYNATHGPEPVATGGNAFGSWMLTEETVTSDVDELARVFEKIGPKMNTSQESFSNPIFIGHFIANSKNRGLDIGLNPAWRDAITHFIVVEGWPADSSKEVIQSYYDDMTFNKTQLLRDLAPGSGAYFNEADPHEPNWQYAFWGPNYERLRKIKEKYDPHGVFWCHNCVGSEQWTEGDNGRLCRSSGR